MKNFLWMNLKKNLRISHQVKNYKFFKGLSFAMNFIKQKKFLDYFYLMKEEKNKFIY